MEKVARCNYSREEEVEVVVPKKLTSPPIPLSTPSPEIISIIKIFSKTNIQKLFSLRRNFLKFLENLLKKKKTQFGILTKKEKKKLRIIVERFHDGIPKTKKK